MLEPPEPVDLDQLSQLEQLATPGPWSLEIGNVGTSHPLFIVTPMANGWRAPTDRDTRLAAALRNAAPALIEELRELRRDKERLEYAMKHLFIQDQVYGTGCHRIYDTRGAIDAAMQEKAEAER